MRLRYPLDRIKITQYFGERPQVYAPCKGHMGIDLRTKWDDSKTGERPVYAAAAGKVSIRDQGNYDYGRSVTIHHFDGSEAIYGHLSQWCVKEGDQVIVGQKIGISGTTGFSDAPHLHFGYRPSNYTSNGYNGYIDPIPYMDSTLTAPYFEKVNGQSPIYFYDYQQNKMVPFADGDTFKMLFGDYQNIMIHSVDQLSKPAAEQPLRRI